MTDILEKFFYPDAIAIIGASTDPTKIGGRPLQQSLELGFPGRIYPVNPKAEIVQGVPAFASVADIPGEVDCAVIALPARGVKAAVQACADKKVALAVILSAGFAEKGAAGLAEQDEILDIASAQGMRLIGPNSMGGLSLESKVSFTFTAQNMHEGKGWPDLGGVSIASQSGFVGSQLMVLFREHGIGIAKWVATGNQCDVDVAECVQHLAEDAITRVIAVYLEGATDGARLCRAFATAREKRKPVVILKVGHSHIGAQAVISHTASLVGGHQVYEAVFRRHNVHSAGSLEALVDVIAACDTGRFPVGTGLGVGTASGGVGVIMADAAEGHGFELPELPADAQAKILEAAPLTTTRNPLDMGSMPFFHHAMEAMVENEAYGTVLAALGHFGLLKRPMETFLEQMTDWRARHPRRFIGLSTNMPDPVRDAFQKLGVFVCNDPTRAVAAAAAVRDIGAGFQDPPDDPPPELTDVAIPVDLAAGGEQAAKKLIAAMGIPVVADRLAKTKEEARAAAETFGGRVVLKIASPDIQHKSDMGGVLVGLSGRQEVAAGFDTLMARAAEAAPEARMDGILVTPLIEGGVETILGVQRDPVFGPVVMFGIGGILVEVLRDTSLRLAPFGPAQARAMIGEIRSHRILEGVRGAEACDLDGLADAIARLSAFAFDNRDRIDSIDINPLIVRPDGVVAVDALVVGAG